MLEIATLEGVYEMPATHRHALIGIDMSFTDQLRAALARKHAAQHPDQKTQDEKSQKQPTAVMSKKPQRKAAGRGR